MQNIELINNTIQYIEDNICAKLCIDDLAKAVGSSKSCLQPKFYTLTGLTIGEYIYMRKMSLSARDLCATNSSIIDIAYKYSYSSPQSFTRAFHRYFGKSPSKLLSQCDTLPYFLPIRLKIEINGGINMNYKLTTTDPLLLTGFHERFNGALSDVARWIQEIEFFDNTRDKQEELYANSQCADECRMIYCILTNFDENGYDFYIAYNCGEREVDGYEKILIPARRVIVFETAKSKYPNRELESLNSTIVDNNLIAKLGFEYNSDEAIVLETMHWYLPDSDKRNERYIETHFPIK